MTEHQRSAVAAEVVIVGGGVAALEALMALRALAGERVRITLVAPDSDFVYRPMAVGVPFGLGAPRRYPLGQVAADFGAHVERAAVVAVDAGERRVVTRGGETLGYDTLILAPGARMLPAFDNAIEFGRAGSAASMRGLLDELEQRVVRRVAFIAPTLAGWTLPLYELALMTAQKVADDGLDAELVLITPEPRPLAVFGTGPSAVVARLLDAVGVEFIGSTYADVERDAIRLDPGGHRRRPVDRTVALPIVRGPELDGVPAEHQYGFIPVDRHGRVAGLEHVYAAGDAIDFPIKQGGLAAQQADAVAHHVAARHGAPVEPRPFTPVLRGMLLTGAAPRFLSAGLGAREGESSASSQALWWPPTKIAGEHLAPYLLERDKAEAEAIGRPPEGFADVEIPLTDAQLEHAGLHGASDVRA
jgi:sulfide:quinone oxidoreductase